MPPVKNSPHKLHRPALRKLTWCTTCLRVSIREWTEVDPVALRPFSVACYAETYDGKSCRHCNGLHKSCEAVPEGIEGNRYELLACLSWTEESWSNYEH